MQIVIIDFNQAQKNLLKIRYCFQLFHLIIFFHRNYFFHCRKNSSIISRILFLILNFCPNSRYQLFKIDFTLKFILIQHMVLKELNFLNLFIKIRHRYRFLYYFNLIKLFPLFFLLQQDYVFRCF